MKKWLILLVWWFVAVGSVPGETWKMHVKIGPFATMEECLIVTDTFLKGEDRSKWAFTCQEL